MHGDVLLGREIITGRELAIRTCGCSDVAFENAVLTLDLQELTPGILGFPLVALESVRVTGDNRLDELLGLVLASLLPARPEDHTHHGNDGNDNQTDHTTFGLIHR